MFQMEAGKVSIEESKRWNSAMKTAMMRDEKAAQAWRGLCDLPSRGASKNARKRVFLFSWHEHLQSEGVNFRPSFWEEQAVLLAEDLGAAKRCLELWILGSQSLGHITSTMWFVLSTVFSRCCLVWTEFSPGGFLWSVCPNLGVSDVLPLPGSTFSWGHLGELWQIEDIGRGWGSLPVGDRAPKENQWGKWQRGILLLWRAPHTQGWPAMQWTWTPLGEAKMFWGWARGGERNLHRKKAIL